MMLPSLYLKKQQLGEWFFLTAPPPFLEASSMKKGESYGFYGNSYVRKKQATSVSYLCLMPCCHSQNSKGNDNPRPSPSLSKWGQGRGHNSTSFSSQALGVFPDILISFLSKGEEEKAVCLLKSYLEGWEFPNPPWDLLLWCNPTQ